MQEKGTGGEKGCGVSKTGEEDGKRERKVGRGTGGGRGNGWAFTEKSRWKEKRKKW